jgi:hypothetical protein
LGGLAKSVMEGPFKGKEESNSFSYYVHGLPDRLAKMAANLKSVTAAMGEAAHTMTQEAVQDRLMSGIIYDAIKSSEQMAARFTIEGSQYPGIVVISFASTREPHTG